MRGKIVNKKQQINKNKNNQIEGMTKSPMHPCRRWARSPRHAEASKGNPSPGPVCLHMNKKKKKKSITWMEQTHGKKYKLTRTPSLLSTFAPQSLCSILVDTSLWMTWNGCRAIRKKTSDKHIIRYGLDVFNWITRWLTDWHQHCMRRCDQTQYITTQNTNIESEFKQRTNMTTPTQRSQPAIQ
jgi:hypothetical protein